MDKQLVVRLDEDTYSALQRHADDTERTISQVVRLAVKALLLNHDALPNHPIPTPPAPLRRASHEGQESSIQRILREAREEEEAEALASE